MTTPHRTVVHLLSIGGINCIYTNIGIQPFHASSRRYFNFYIFTHPTALL